jgi:hypothetical protein
MGQYHIVVNLDKQQVVHPHKIGCGLKLWEQLASQISTGTALIILLASGSNGDGGGDICEDPIVGSWRGDRIAFVGDYDDSTKYKVGKKTMSGAEIYTADWIDVSGAVCKVIEKELNGKFVGDGWRQFKYNDGTDSTLAMKPDMVISL